MTTEEKELLLKDLCARLPYRTKILITGEGGIEIDADLTTSTIDYFESWTVQPYLRPMSSMTEEEYYGEYQCKVLIMRDADETLHWSETVDSIDWLLEHHFDFRGLIEKGLALEAPKDMYKEK